MEIRLGTFGNDVRWLQEFLKIDKTGVFDIQTDMHVRRYQHRNGFVINGIVDKNLFNHMHGQSFTSGIQKLRGIIPDNVVDQLPQTIEKFELNTPLRLAHFLSQCGHESANFTILRENLNYSVNGLLAIFKKYFPTRELAEQYARKPEKIANKVYADRMANGSENSGDGWKYRGRGYIQLTGRHNYTLFGNSIGVDIVNDPERVATEFPLLSAGWFYHSNGIHRISDEGSSRTVIEKVTRRVNGGLNGIEDRVKKFGEYYKLLT